MKAFPSVDTVTVVLPVRDEAKTVALAIESLADQTVGAQRLEVLVYDGMSSDGTRELCESYAKEHAWKRFDIVTNLERVVPYALNAGLAASTCPWFMRLDGRSSISPNYIEACLGRLGAEEMIAAGGRLKAHADGPVASAIAAAVTHPIGVGRGFRNARAAGTALPHHPFALWRTDELRKLGGFDVTLTRNQDDEFSMRATKRGWRIFLVPDAEVVYRPRERIRSLAGQYFQYGLWKGVVARRHGLFPKTSAVPAAMTFAWVSSLALLAAGKTAWPVRSLVASYLAAGMAVTRNRPSTNPVLVASSLCVMHASYGAGVIAGLIQPTLAETRLGHGRLR
jgi:cellulose synthase/poly-beta-1,6-N-acetylglucosamine synthase-like glycosyltransferase